MKDINLIYFQVVNKTQKSRKIILGAMLLVIIGILISFGTLLSLIEKNGSEITAVKKEMNQYVEVTILKTDIKIYNEKLKQMKDVLDSASEKSVLNIKLLKQIAKAMPSDVYIVNYSISKTREITIVGKSGSNDSIAHFRYKLDESKEFDTIAVKTIKSEDSRDEKERNSGPNYTFDMSIKLK